MACLTPLTTPPPPSPPVVPTSRTVSTGPPRQLPELVRQAPQPLDGAEKDASEPEPRIMTVRPRLKTSSQVRGRKNPVLLLLAQRLVFLVVSPPLPPPPQ